MTRYFFNSAVADRLSQDDDATGLLHITALALQGSGGRLIPSRLVDSTVVVVVVVYLTYGRYHYLSRSCGVIKSSFSSSHHKVRYLPALDFTICRFRIA